MNRVQSIKLQQNTNRSVTIGNSVAGAPSVEEKQGRLQSSVFAQQNPLNYQFSATFILRHVDKFVGKTKLKVRCSNQIKLSSTIDCTSGHWFCSLIPFDNSCATENT